MIHVTFNNFSRRTKIALKATPYIAPGSITRMTRAHPNHKTPQSDTDQPLGIRLKAYF